MGVRRIRIDFHDDSGCHHTISLEGPLSRDKIARILDYAELMGGFAPQSPIGNPHEYPRTKLDRVRDLVLHRLRDNTFSSDEVRSLYQHLYGESVPPTTVATYLARLADRGLVRRSFTSGRWRYCLADKLPSVSLP